MILLNAVNIYDEEGFAGTSVVPFLAFCMLVVAIMVSFFAIVNIVSAWREFRIFYDQSALEEKPDPQEKNRKIRKNSIILVFGIALYIISQVILNAL